jgi:hypothetical protein
MSPIVGTADMAGAVAGLAPVDMTHRKLVSAPYQSDHSSRYNALS